MSTAVILRYSAGKCKAVTNICLDVAMVTVGSCYQNNWQLLVQSRIFGLEGVLLRQTQAAGIGFGALSGFT